MTEFATFLQLQSVIASIILPLHEIQRKCEAVSTSPLARNNSNTGGGGGGGERDIHPMANIVLYDVMISSL